MVADMPFVMTALDQLDVPVTIFNNLDHEVEATLTPSMTAESTYLEASIAEFTVTIPPYSS